MLTVVCGMDSIVVRFDHRFCDSNEIEYTTGLNVEGERRCSIATVTLNGKLYSRGMVVCHPGDNFCKATGRKKALICGLGSLNKKLRTAVWDEYKSKFNL